jgi:hypothetical protein
VKAEAKSCETKNPENCNSKCCPATTSGQTAGNGNMRLALDPVQSDFLAMNIKNSDEKPYNIHELPMIDGKTNLFHLKHYSFTQSLLF